MGKIFLGRICGVNTVLKVRLLAVFLLAGCLLLQAAGCRKNPERKPVKPQLRVGLSVADAARDGNIIIRKVMDEKGRAAKVRIVFADARNDPLRQEKDIERLVDKERVRAIVVQFVDPVTAGGIVRRLKEAGVKVIALETLSPDSPFDAYVASDHSRAGELMARFILENIPVGGKAPARVLFIGGEPADPGMAGIASSFQSLFQIHPQIKVLVENIDLSDPAKVPALIDRVFSEYGRIDAIAAADSRFAVEAEKALRERGLVDQVVTAGIGADRRATDLMSAGRHEAEVDVQPEMLGSGAFTAAVDLVRHGDWRYQTRVSNGDFSIPAQIVPVRLIRPESLYLLTERWRQYGGGGEEGSSPGNKREKSNSSAESKPEKNTRLRVTTQDGRRVEVDIPGEVQRIETVK